MGYYTEFELVLKGKMKNVEKFLTDDPCVYYEKFSKMFYQHDGIFYGNDNWKWYEYHDDMTSLSTEYPKILFELTGYGEERGDIWRKFYKNGVVSGGKAIIAFPEYEEENE